MWRFFLVTCGLIALGTAGGCARGPGEPPIPLRTEQPPETAAVIGPEAICMGGVSYLDYPNGGRVKHVPGGRACVPAQMQRER